MTRRDKAIPTAPAAPSAGAVRRAKRAAARRPRWRRFRVGIFAVVALTVGALAVSLVVSRLSGPPASDVSAVQIHASMGGFDPVSLTVRAGATVKVELSSTDTSMHSDGGGWHQLAIDALGLNWKVGPLSSKVFEFTAPVAPGTYAWYCDICCGGKANPSMQGTLTVTA
jgi:hypothetical protein